MAVPKRYPEECRCKVLDIFVTVGGINRMRQPGHTLGHQRADQMTALT